MGIHNARPGHQGPRPDRDRTSRASRAWQSRCPCATTKAPA